MNILENNITNELLPTDMNDRNVIAEKHESFIVPYRDCHEEYELVFIEKGTGIITINKERIKIVPGLIYFILPNETHEIESIKDSPILFYLIKFKLDNYGFKALNILPPQSCWHILEKNTKQYYDTLKILTVLIDEFAQIGWYFQLARNLIFEYTLLYFSRLLNEVTVNKEEPYSNLIETVLIYINRNYYKNIKLKDIAAKFYVNPQYLSKLFHESVGISFGNYEKELKMKFAKELLVTTSFPITSVSEMCGYNSYANFTRVFRAYYGITPTICRKNSQ